jgi:predicted transcriptional regulator
MSMVKGLIFDPSENGLRKTLKEYQELALRYLWDNGEEGAGSGPVWRAVNDELQKHGGSISRASIINFLNDMVDEGVLDYHEASGKGGFHRVYKPKMDESELKKYIAETVLASLMRDFPNETNEAIKAIDT